VHLGVVGNLLLQSADRCISEHSWFCVEVRKWIGSTIDSVHFFSRSQERVFGISRIMAQLASKFSLLSLLKSKPIGLGKPPIRGFGIALKSSNQVLCACDVKNSLFFLLNLIIIFFICSLIMLQDLRLTHVW
jgi:hypothetical protein